MYLVTGRVDGVDHGWESEKKKLGRREGKKRRDLLPISPGSNVMQFAQLLLNLVEHFWQVLALFLPSLCGVVVLFNSFLFNQTTEDLSPPTNFAHQPPNSRWKPGGLKVEISCFLCYVSGEDLQRDNFHYFATRCRIGELVKVTGEKNGLHGRRKKLKGTKKQPHNIEGKMASFSPKQFAVVGLGCSFSPTNNTQKLDGKLSRSCANCMTLDPGLIGSKVLSLSHFFLIEQLSFQPISAEEEFQPKRVLLIDSFGWRSGGCRLLEVM
jgi:hypothetical protein